MNVIRTILFLILQDYCSYSDVLSSTHQEYEMEMFPLLVDALNKWGMITRFHMTAIQGGVWEPHVELLQIVSG